MIEVQPSVKLIATPDIDWSRVMDYLNEVDGTEWSDRVQGEDKDSPGEDLVEFSGRMCYRSWKPGLNPNVSKVREDSGEYLSNVIRSQHGSVLEHANFTFVLQDVSRVLTHELVRHRAGMAYSQESLRYVRLTEIPFWIPEWVREDREVYNRVIRQVERAEEFQEWMTDYYNLDDEKSFAKKKHVTSFMRRLAPEGLATSIVMTANVRGLRHMIEMRTAQGAEEEIRLVFDQVATIMKDEAPNLFGDYTVEDGAWIPGTRKA